MHNNKVIICDVQFLTIMKKEILLLIIKPKNLENWGKWYNYFHGLSLVSTLGDYTTSYMNTQIIELSACLVLEDRQSYNYSSNATLFFIIIFCL